MGLSILTTNRVTATFQVIALQLSLVLNDTFLRFFTYLVLQSNALHTNFLQTSYIHFATQYSLNWAIVKLPQDSSVFTLAGFCQGRASSLRLYSINEQPRHFKSYINGLMLANDSIACLAHLMWTSCNLFIRNILHLQTAKSTGVLHYTDRLLFVCLIEAEIEWCTYMPLWLPTHHMHVNIWFHIAWASYIIYGYLSILENHHKLGHTLRMGCVVPSAKRQKVACDAVHRKLLWVRREAVL